MNVEEHYNNHLGNFYSWMTGDFRTKCNEFRSFLIENSIAPSVNGVAIDLGSAHGIQSVPLAETGFQVIAVDFNQQLLNELKANAQGLEITVINDDIRKIERFYNKPELIVCCGDTLSHLDNKSDIQKFIANIERILEINGKLILSFRDYSTELAGNARFIPVKNDENKILTCILGYEDEFVNVTDLLHERIDNAWLQKVSSYRKVRVTAGEVLKWLEKSGMQVNFNKIINGLITIIATKENNDLYNAAHLY